MQCETLLIAICAIDFLNAFEKLRLLKALKNLGGGAEGALSFLESATLGQIAALARRDPMRPLLVKRWSGGELLRLAQVSARACQSFGIELALYGKKNYPPPLMQICDPPFALFYRGNMAAVFGKNVSVVGTRRITPDGKRAARDFAWQAAAAGFCVVSGLAIGADGSAHQGALDAFFDQKTGSCKTAAVLAGGVDNVFPACHKKMAAQIIQNGGVVLSECAPGIPAEKWRFVSRNRIIAALSPATVVIQAPPGSGAMLTADFALGYNRELFFHESCFSQGASVVSNLVFKNLQAQTGAAAARKIEASPQKYVDSGAPVIRNFEEFAALLGKC